MLACSIKPIQPSVKDKYMLVNENLIDRSHNVHCIFLLSLLDIVSRTNMENVHLALLCVIDK